MLAVVTGATGLLGGNLVRELLRAGHRVRATHRLAIGPSGAVDWVAASLDDRSSLVRAFHCADVVFHCAAQLSLRKRPTPELTRVNVDGTRNVVAAVREAGVARLVHCSTVAAVGLSTDGRPCDETTPWNLADERLDDGYATTKRRAEEIVIASDDIDRVVVNPAYLIGPNDPKPSSGAFLIALARRQVPICSPGTNNFVDVRDVARGMIAAWQRGRRGERYILGGENCTYEDIMRRIANIAGVPPPLFRSPRAIASVAGAVSDAWVALSGIEPRFNSMSVRWGYCDRFIFTSQKAERELGYSAGSVDDAIRDALAWFRETGKL